MNEPAFPMSRSHFSPEGKMLSSGWVSGMTLRDYFAAKAMNGRVSGRCRDLGNEMFNQETCEGIARVSYLMADAMLKSRTEPKGE